MTALEMLAAFGFDPIPDPRFPIPDPPALT